MKLLQFGSIQAYGSQFCKHLNCMSFLKVFENIIEMREILENKIFNRNKFFPNLKNDHIVRVVRLKGVKYRKLAMFQVRERMTER